MALVTSSPRQNLLLAALPEREYLTLLEHLEPVELVLGQTLHESGAELHEILFPTSALASLLCVTADGSSAEIALVGNDGFVGIALILGSKTVPHRAVVQSAGEAYRLSASHLRQALTRTGGRRRDLLPPLLLRYTLALTSQMAQTAVCNRHHTVDQQLCRWLLLSLDRLPSNELLMTQELIANMLGVRREGVTEAAGRLQRAGLITYRRGRIVVLDRAGLEARACECYEVVKNECRRLFSDIPFSP
jgi:CRP-like cAMP-binding protein